MKSERSERARGDVYFRQTHAIRRGLSQISSRDGVDVLTGTDTGGDLHVETDKLQKISAEAVREGIRRCGDRRMGRKQCWCAECDIVFLGEFAEEWRGYGAFEMDVQIGFGPASDSVEGIHGNALISLSLISGSFGLTPMVFVSKQV